MDKQAAYKQAFLGKLIPRSAKPFVDATRASRLKFLQEENNSLIGFALSSAREHGALGAQKVTDVINKGRLAVSDLDTGLGHWAAGKKYGLPRGKRGLRSAAFTDGDMRSAEHPLGLPSVTAPIKSVVGKFAIPWLAYMKATELSDGLLHKNKVVQHEPGIVEDSSVPL